MSTVTNTILTFALDEERYTEEHPQGDDARGVIAEVNEYWKQKYGDAAIVSDGFRHPPEVWHGGTKALECYVFVAAFNYLGLKEFVKHLRSIKWDAPSRVQLFVQEQEDDVFREVHLFDATPGEVSR